MYVKAFTANVDKRLKPLFLEQHINIVNRVKAFGLSVSISHNLSHVDEVV